MPRRLLGLLGLLAAGLAACQGGGASAPPSGTRPAPPPRPAPPGDWPQFGVDAARGNAQPTATGIRPAALAGIRPRVVTLPGTVDSSPIYLHGVDVAGRRRNAFFMTTTYGRTLAVSPAGRILWTYTPPGYAALAGTAQITTATPAADPGRRFLYAASPDGRIHRLSVADGREVTAGGWPVSVTRLPRREKIAAALTVSGRRLYVATGGYVGDAPPYQGHVVAIELPSGTVAGVFNTLCSDRAGLLDPASCPDSDSAIWGRAGVVVDPAGGELLVATGNGRFDGRTAWGDSVLMLSPDASRLVGSWTPRDQASLEAGDVDVGSTAPALLTSRLAVQGGKDGKLRLLDLRRLRAARGRTGGELQTVPTPGNAGLFSTPAVSRGGGAVRLFVATGSGTWGYVLRGGRLGVAWRRDTAGTSPVLGGASSTSTTP